MHQHSPGLQPPSPGIPGPAGQVSGARNIDTSIDCEGCQFRISYRDSNSLLSCRLPPGYELKAKPGSMVAMDASVKIKGKVRVSILGPKEP